MQDILQRSVFNMIQTLPNSKTASFVKECLYLWGKYPEIGNAIQQDLDNYAKLKKYERLEDRQYELNMSMSLPDFDELTLVPESPDALTLAQGSPRMPAVLVYIFLQLRGFWSSVSDQVAVDRMLESVTISIILSNLGKRMPGRSTIHENVNKISNETRELIFECQLADTLELGLDDFRQVCIDSTSVEANNCWPTDAGVIRRLLGRAINLFKTVESFGISPLAEFYLMNWMTELGKLHFKINNTRGTKGAPKKRIKLYKDFIRTASKAMNYLIRNFIVRRMQAERCDLKPSKRRKLDMFIDAIEQDLQDVGYVITYAGNRVFDGVSLPSAEKIISLSDDSAAFIRKGARNDVIGYKPQLMRSMKGGFVTALFLEKGNPSDSKSLVPTVNQHIKATGVVPQFISADDGYSLQDAVDSVKEIGVTDICLSGAKGKRILGDELWNREEYIEGRRKRSAVESLMFTLKYSYEFGRMRRRGLEEVKAEMLEKVTAYNICRAIDLKQAKSKEDALVSLPKAG